MEIKETIGIDVSKLVLDVHIHSCRRAGTFKNSREGLGDMIKWVLQNSKFDPEYTLYAFEHTGLYAERLKRYLSENDYPFIMIPGLEIKRSQGIARGKDDKIDAERIALYAFRLRDELEPSSIRPRVIERIKILSKLRDRLVKQRAGYKSSLGEQREFLEEHDGAFIFKIQEQMIQELSLKIKMVDSEIRSILETNARLTEIFGLLKSIKGLGDQTAIFLITCTEGFTKFDNARKFAAYCGIAPYPNRSGTGLRGRTRVSHIANKKVKTLLDLCAKVSIQHNDELKQYYERRVEEGKSKMGTINAIRYKLLARAFAVIKRGTPYVELYRYAS